MPIRMIAIDLDGTLLDSRSELSTRNQAALAEAAGRGAEIVIVTGRRFQSARPFVEQIPCPVTVISSNGARIAASSGEVLHRDFLPRPVALQVLEAARRHRQYAVAIFDTPGCGQVVMYEDAAEESPLSWYRRNSPDALLQVAEVAAAMEADPIQLMFGGPPERIEPIEMLLRASPLAAAIHLTWTKYFARNVSLLDCMNRGCTKGRALALYAARRSINPAEVMAIGDNYNDFEMLDFAGWPVLMGNSCPGIGPERGDGRWRMTLSNDEDGVAAAIRKYVLEA